jgi:hypothetical protein
LKLNQFGGVYQPYPLPFEPRQFLPQHLHCLLIGVADADSITLPARQPHQLPELAGNGRWIPVIVEKHIAPGYRYLVLLRNLLRHCFLGGAAVDEIQFPVVPHTGHEPIHGAWMAG